MGNNDGDDNKDIIMDDVLKLKTTKRRKNGVQGEAAMRVCKSSVTHEYRGKKKLKRLCDTEQKTSWKSSMCFGNLWSWRSFFLSPCWI